MVSGSLSLSRNVLEVPMSSELVKCHHQDEKQPQQQQLDQELPEQPKSEAGGPPGGQASGGQ